MSQKIKKLFTKSKYRLNSSNTENVSDWEDIQNVTLRSKHYSHDDTYLTESEDEIVRRRHKRHSFPLESQIIQNTENDSRDDGSPFVTDWFLYFTNGQLKLSFNDLFDALIDGIRKEGQLRSESELNKILNDLIDIKTDDSIKSEDKRMKQLEEACAKLYTKTSFLFEVVNRTLRDSDRSKLTSLGPYCFLVYNYIGSQIPKYTLIQRYIGRIGNSTQSSSIVVYRGCGATMGLINGYRQAAGQKDKYFKWLSFVSTSLDENVAKTFIYNVLYEIKLHQKASNDQFANLENISYHVDEREILLRPGVRFRVSRVETIETDKVKDITKIYISIVPSFISRLM
ncbi:unnamed protein product [Rotaria magnacalcarata]|uniref:ADP ribosyltransferase domain-containing protein n=1 Tax=Rotaria magnacalcarata TaxID=392030 RepID=A0A816MYL5_9BILA|nr:unnamed protein product [Rotaria magnacalcarata]CAF2007911.1 unnamed protein product [Rotaria magnacalcarata]CAF4139611.1 unnamed protein product [Rotaria magnacalcarata]CAF4615382.1 unnamed protein product [Rotaria magnacalcarata]